MKLSVSVTDQRTKAPAYLNEKPQFEDYERVNFIDLDAPPEVLAATLRGIADDIAPKAGAKVSPAMSFEYVR